MRDRPLRRPTLASLAVALAAGALLWAGLGGAATAPGGNRGQGRGRENAPGQVAKQTAAGAAHGTAHGAPVFFSRAHRDGHGRATPRRHCHRHRHGDLGQYPP